MGSYVNTLLVRLFAGPNWDEGGEVNASMIAWMVVAALVVFGFRATLTGMLTDTADFVSSTLGV